MSQVTQMREDAQNSLVEVEQGIEQADLLIIQSQKEQSEFEVGIGQIGQVITHYKEGDEAYGDCIADSTDSLQIDYAEMESTITEGLSIEAESEDLDHLLEECLATKDNMQEQCDNLEQTLDKELSETETDCQSSGDNLEQSHQDCQDCHTAYIEQLLQGNQQAYNQGKASIIEVGETTTKMLSEWNQLFQGELTDTLKDSFDGHYEAIDQDGAVITDIAQSFQQETSGAINSHHETCSDLGEELRSRCCETIENVSNHATEVFQRELNEAFTNVTNKIIEEVLEEIVKNIAMAQFGAATTTAIGPILPQIVIAKKALEVINEILSLGGLFD